MTQEPNDNKTYTPAKPAIAFYCAKGCRTKFEETNYHREPHEEQDWHPWRYYATCPTCGFNADQSPWQLAGWKSAHTGKTPEGRRRISEANKKRDPESYAISRFNAITHGANAATAKYFPARPGHYPVCDGCEYIHQGCGAELKHCAKRTELFVQFHLAQEQGDGAILGQLMAETQAGFMAITGDMIRAVAARGVEIETPMIKHGEDGPDVMTWKDDEGVERAVTKVEANPLLYPLLNFVAKNGMTLKDMNLTPAAKEEQQRFQGFLDAKEQETESLQQAQQDSRDQLAALQAIITGGGKPGNTVNATSKRIAEIEDAQVIEDPKGDDHA